MLNPNILELENNSFIDYYSGYFSEYEMSKILAEISLKQNYISIYGKTIPLPRLTAWYGDAGASYYYSGIMNKPEPWTETLSIIKDNISVLYKMNFNSCLVNFYRNGKDGVAAHSDDEQEISETIASVSLGAERVFRMRSKLDGQKIDLTLRHGDLMVMRGDTQQFWTHEIVKTKKKIDGRLNFTFRQVKI